MSTLTRELARDQRVDPRANAPLRVVVRPVHHRRGGHGGEVLQSARVGAGGEPQLRLAPSACSRDNSPGSATTSAVPSSTPYHVEAARAQGVGRDARHAVGQVLLRGERGRRGGQCGEARRQQHDGHNAAHRVRGRHAPARRRAGPRSPATRRRRRGRAAAAPPPTRATPSARMVALALPTATARASMASSALHTAAPASVMRAANARRSGADRGWRAAAICSTASVSARRRRSAWNAATCPSADRTRAALRRAASSGVKKRAWSASRSHRAAPRARSGRVNSGSTKSASAGSWGQPPVMLNR